MKTSRLITLILLALGLAAALFGQTVVESLMRIQCDPATGTATAFFQKTVTVGGQGYAQPWTQVTWSVTSTKDVTYTYNGKSYTEPYAQVMAAVVAIANQENAP